MSFLRSRNGAAVLAGCLFVLLISIFFARSKREESAAARTSELGSVESIIGEAEHRLPREVGFQPLKENALLQSGELVFVREASQVTLKYRGDASIRLQPGARVVSENDSSYQEAVMVTVIEGDVDILSTGRPKSFRLFKNGREITDGKTVSTVPVLASGSGPRTFAKPEADVVVTASTPAETPVPVPVTRASDETGGNATADSLSNDEIRRSLRSASGFFQRCYLTYLNRSKRPSTERSTITVGFVISNSGQVRDSKIVRTDVNDPVLNKCILETVDRTPFRAFKAADIPVLEFPIELR